jgi:hypothetical protein
MNALRETLTLWRTAAIAPFHRKLLWTALFFALPLWLWLVYEWPLIPLARVWQLAAVAVSGLLLLALFGLALFSAFRMSDLRMLARPVNWIAVVVWAGLGLWLPYRIVWWVTPLGSVRAETISLVVRFAVADKLACYALLWLAAVLAKPAVTRTASVTEKST